MYSIYGFGEVLRRKNYEGACKQELSMREGKVEDYKEDITIRVG